MTKQFRILTIVPKVDETIVAIFHNETCIFQESIEINNPFSFENNDLSKHITDQKQRIIKKLHEAGINLSKLQAVSSIGGMLKPVEGGTYLINETMISHLRENYNGKHISNLGALIAYEIAHGLNIQAYIVDPPVVDEFIEEATYTGVPSIKRKSIFHALNQKAVARLAANELNKPYDHVNLIVCHLGIGITVGAHRKGKIIDVNNGLHGDGPFSIERAGTLPIDSLISLCFSNQYNEEELVELLTFHSGLKAYFKSTQIDTIITRLTQVDEETTKILKAMTYQIAKEIGSMATVLKGDVDGIVLTGVLAENDLIKQRITERTSWIADVFIYPGEYDLQALNEGTLRVLRKEEIAKNYT